jgi:hypothetical protein
VFSYYRIACVMCESVAVLAVLCPDLGLSVCMGVWVCMGMCVCIHICVYAYRYAYSGVCVCVCMHTIMHTNHVHMYIHISYI